MTTDAEWLEEFPPYAGKSWAEIIHDYAVIRGDLSEQYARDQLVNLIWLREKQARADAVREASRAGWLKRRLHKGPRL